MVIRKQNDIIVVTSSEYGRDTYFVNGTKWEGVADVLIPGKFDGLGFEVKGDKGLVLSQLQVLSGIRADIEKASRFVTLVCNDRKFSWCGFQTPEYIAFWVEQNHLLNYLREHGRFN